MLFSSNPPPSLSSIQHVTSSEDGKERFYGSEIWSRIGGYSHPAAGGRLLQYGIILLLSLLLKKKFNLEN